MGKRAKKSKQPPKSEGDLRARLEEAEKDRDWLGLDDTLYEACNHAPEVLKPILSRFIEHRQWVIRASALEIAGMLGWKQFSEQVASHLHDRNGVVRSYALTAYYDLHGAKALSVIDEFCTDKDVHLRAEALALRYIQTADVNSLERLGRILRRKNCDYHHCYAVLHAFEYYCEPGPDDKVIELFADILPDFPKNSGLAKDIKRLIAKWKQSKKSEEAHPPKGKKAAR